LLGQATLQLAKLAGARVIATTRRAGKAATLREFGTDAVVGTADAVRAIRITLPRTERTRG
jgi:NADPH:quinone reductase-like Zn-dependent oxidoreductase